MNLKNEFFLKYNIKMENKKEENNSESKKVNPVDKFVEDLQEKKRLSMQFTKEKY